MRGYGKSGKNTISLESCTAWRNKDTSIGYKMTRSSSKAIQMGRNGILFDKIWQLMYAHFYLSKIIITFKAPDVELALLWNVLQTLGYGIFEGPEAALVAAHVENFFLAVNDVFDVNKVKFEGIELLQFNENIRVFIGPFVEEEGQVFNVLFRFDEFFQFLDIFVMHYILKLAVVVNKLYHPPVLFLDILIFLRSFVEDSVQFAMNYLAVCFLSLQLGVQWVST